jgi:hypothetical protein
MLELGSNFFEALVERRPISTERRKFDDVDHAIRKFFLEIFNPEDVEDPLLLKLLRANDSEQVSEFTFRVPSGSSIERVN